MTTSRRGFLGTCATALAGLAMVRLPERWTLPVLYGDGVHDDTAALQALIDGERAWDADEGRVLHYPHKPCMLPPGSYCFTTLNIGPGQRIDFGRAPVALHSPTWWGNAL